MIISVHLTHYTVCDHYSHRHDSSHVSTEHNIETLNSPFTSHHTVHSASHRVKIHRSSGRYTTTTMACLIDWPAIRRWVYKKVFTRLVPWCQHAGALLRNLDAPYHALQAPPIWWQRVLVHDSLVCPNRLLPSAFCIRRARWGESKGPDLLNVLCYSRRQRRVRTCPSGTASRQQIVYGTANKGRASNEEFSSTRSIARAKLSQCALLLMLRLHGMLS